MWSNPGLIREPSTDESRMVSHEEKKDAKEQFTAALTGFGAGVVWVLIVAVISYQIAIH